MSPPSSTVGSPAGLDDRDPAGPRRSFRNDLAHTTATNLGISLASVVTGVLVARLLNPAGRGELAAILNWPTLLGMLTTLGLSEALVFFSAKQRNRAGRYLSTAMVLSLAASTVFVALGWLLMPWLLAAQDPGVVDAARWYLLQIPVAAVIGLVIGPLRGVGDVRSWNLLRSAPTVIWLVIVVAFRLGSDRAEPEALALTFVATRAALAPFAIWFVRRRLRQALRPDPSLARPLVRYGLPNALSTLPATLNLRLDQLLIVGFLPPGDLGLYAVAVAWSFLPSPALYAFGAVLFPRVAEHADPGNARDLAARGVRVAIALSAVLTIATMAITPLGLPLLFGHRFDVAVPTAMVLTVAAGIIGITRVQEEALRGLGRPVSVLGSQLVSLVVTVVGLALTVPSGRLAHIALASVVGYAVLSAVLLTQLVRATGLGLHRLVLPAGDDVHVVLAHLRRPVSGRSR
jgi:enterobacterial common antigen flippase